MAVTGKSRSGHYELHAENRHFIPVGLPPEPGIALDKELLELYGEAMQSLGKFSEAQTRIPNKRQFIDVYIAKEAVYTSQIENINTTLPQVLEYQSKQKSSANKEVQEVLNYIESLHLGIDLLRDKNLPLTSELIKACHARLLAGVRGERKSPGEYRAVPVFVGKLVPPPAGEIEGLINSLEKFIHEDKSILPLIKCALAHVQFEIIHPFLDGNGRIGRLLIVLMMVNYGLISEPVIYPSFFFLKFRSEYYDRLDAVRVKGDYEGWIKYFLRGIKACADDIVQRAWAIDQLLQECTSKLKELPSGVRRNAEVMLDQLCHNPVLTASDVMRITGSSYNTAQKLLNLFVELEIITTNSGQLRNKSYTFRKYLNVLETGFLE